MNILLVAEESAGIQLLRGLNTNGHHAVTVMASPAKKADSRATVWDAARSLGYRTWPANLVKTPELSETLRAEKVDILLNVHSLFIIRKEVLEAVRIGSFNLHPGPLPRYAGLNPVSWAIYRGEREHGVTVHWIVPKLDAGPIAYQELFSIQGNDTAFSVFSQCIKRGIALMLRLLEVAAHDPRAVPRIPQDMAQREYFGPEVPEEGRLIWSDSAQHIVDFVRACDFSPFSSPWGHPRTKLGHQSIRVVKAVRTGEACGEAPGRVGRVNGSGVSVACRDEWVSVTRLMIDGRVVNASDILKSGYQLDHGD